MVEPKWKIIPTIAIKYSKVVKFFHCKTSALNYCSLPTTKMQWCSVCAHWHNSGVCDTVESPSCRKWNTWPEFKAVCTCGARLRSPCNPYRNDVKCHMGLVKVSAFHPVGLLICSHINTITTLVQHATSKLKPLRKWSLFPKKAFFTSFDINFFTRREFRSQNSFVVHWICSTYSSS